MLPLSQIPHSQVTLFQISKYSGVEHAPVDRLSEFPDLIQRWLELVKRHLLQLAWDQF